ncbi:MULTISPECIES: hypothetical protein [Streptomyces]|uniref:Uncharacterized protein n=1 Tax=Streptomyces achmelvichensis TaxID=3134111 RepID=A0ACC6PP60_9ACTN|nr:hypothetical protein OG317_03475 [Streptomyces sp. NBC_01167]
MAPDRDDSKLAVLNRLIIRTVCLAIGVWVITILVGTVLFVWW